MHYVAHGVHELLEANFTVTISIHQSSQVFHVVLGETRHKLLQQCLELCSLQLP